jgi:hypothetical protein
LLANHTHFYQSILSNRATVWRFFIAIISWANVLLILIWTCLLISRGITGLLFRKCGIPSCNENSDAIRMRFTKPAAPS